MLSVESRIRWSPRVAFQNVAGRIVVASPAARTISELNEVGSFLWDRMMEEGATILRLAEDVTMEYDVEDRAAREDVLEFAREMLGLGLLEEA